MERCYLSGPMSGLPELNIPAFTKAAKDLRAKGFAVLNPAEMNSAKELEWHEYLRADLRLLVECDTIALLPNWDRSRGATLELAVAIKLGMRVIDATTGEDLPIEVKFGFQCVREEVIMYGTGANSR